LFLELVQNGIAKKLPAQKVEDFKGDFNYLHSMLDNLKKPPSEPSMALIRQIVTEMCIFPLGSKLVKDRAEFVKSVLFYGPPGTGKTLMARAIAHETASLVFDLSPLAVDGKYSEK
jgi:SpoVK/Ycf46/Vps4 family AAA+-type ATPase